MMSMRRRTLKVATYVTLLALASCGDRGTQEERSAVPAQRPGPAAVPEFNVGHVGHDHQLALYVAALEGDALEPRCGAYLKEIKRKEVYDLMEGGTNHARLHLIKVGGGSRMPAAMERGEIDIGLGGVAPVAFFVDKGNPFKIVFPLQTDGDMLVMRPDFPATDWNSFVDHVNSSDRALKIGYKAPVAVAKLIFAKGLDTEAIRVATAPGEEGGKIGLVNLQGEGNMVPSLLSGAVDGFVINQPHASTAVYKKAGKIVCDLSTLPPAGKWEQHPCCCVAATESVIAGHRGILKAFLKVLHAATELITSDQQLAIRDAAAWTKLPEEVERDSVPSVKYLNVPTAKWKSGMETWAEMMADLGKFTGSLRDKSAREVADSICDLSIIEEILSESEAQDVSW